MHLQKYKKFQANAILLQSNLVQLLEAAGLASSNQFHGFHKTEEYGYQIKYKFLS